MEKPAVSPLILPGLPAGVPSRVETYTGGRWWGKLGLLLLEGGIARPSDVGNPFNETVFCLNALNRWLNESISGMSVLRLKLQVHRQPDETFWPLRRTGAVDPAGDSVCFVFAENGQEIRTVSEALTLLESERPGLGETAMYLIGRGLGHTAEGVNPWSAFESCKWLYWGGEEDERMIVEEYAGMGEDPESIDVYRREDYLREVPLWAAQPKQRIGRRELDALRKSQGNSPVVRRAAEAMLRIHSVLDCTLPGMDGTETFSLGNSVILRWNDRDDVIRIVDDHYNRIMNDGDGLLEVFGLDFLPMDDPGRFREWFRGVERGFRLMGAVDRLIRMVSRGHLDLGRNPVSDPPLLLLPESAAA